MSQIKDCTKELSGYYGDSDDLFGSQDNSQTDDFKASAKLVDLEGLHDVIQSSQTTLNKLIKDFQRSTSKAAEASRKIKSLTADKTAIEEAEGNVEKSESTNATIDILAEHTNIQSVNSNYEICKSEGAGVGIWAKNVGINAIDAKEGIMSNSNFLVNTQHILLTTANKKLNGDTLDIPAEGDVKITSRNITLASVDKEYKTGDSSTGVTEKQLAKGGKIQLRAKNVSVDSQTTEGEAEGEFSVNSKLVKMGAVTATNATVAKDSLIDLNYEGARIASTEWLCLHSDKNTLVSAKENLEIQQDQDKAALQLTKGKTTLKAKTPTSWAQLP